MIRIAITPVRAVEIFVVANLAFLGLDILIAHGANDFERRVEWAPVVFSAIAAVLLLPTAFGARARVFRILDVIFGAGSIVVGVTGLVLHLQSAFFARQTLHELVYSAPFVAPLAYVGVGLLLLLVRTEPPNSPVLGSWIVLLALGGFLGNFALSLLDHAQNAFFRWSEWIPVFSAAFAVSFLGVLLVRPSAALARVTYAVLGVQAIVGVLGFFLHALLDYRRASLVLADRFLFGAPAFAPLLFTNLALLGALGIWAMRRGAAASKA
jgi:hypothetical protein